MSSNESPAKHGRPSYPLTAQERAYLAKGDAGTYRESDIEERIQKKAGDLGQRIDHLLSDVELLAENGYLDEENWSDAWLEFIGFDSSDLRPQNDIRGIEDFAHGDEEPDHSDVVDACTVAPKLHRPRPTSGPEQVAIQIGAMLDRLILVPDGVNGEEMKKEIAWGLVEGLLRYRKPVFSVMGDGRRELKEEFIEYQQKRLRREIHYDQDSRQWYEEMRKGSKEWSEARQNMRGRVREILTEADNPIGPKSPKPELHKRIDDDPVDTNPEGIHTDVVLDLLIDHLVEAPDDIDDYPALGDKPGTSGQWALFQRQFGPLERFHPEEVVSEEVVLEVVSKHNLVAKGKLSVHVEEDVETLQEAHWKGIEATDVVREIGSSDEPLRSSAIADTIAKRSHQALVTKLCKDLAGREFEREIVDGDNSGWELTPYGELVSREAFGTVFGQFGGHMSGAEEAALIEQAADQLDIEGWQYSQLE